MVMPIHKLWCACVIGVVVASWLAVVRADNGDTPMRPELFRSNKDAQIAKSLRVMVRGTSGRLRCVLKNVGTQSVAVDELYHATNGFVLTSVMRSGWIGCTAHSPNTIVVQPGQSKVWMLDIGDLAKYAGGGTRMPGYVTSVQWWCVKGPRTPSIWIALPEEGRFAQPVPSDGLVTAMLALLYQEGKPVEVLCFLMNGTKEELVAVEPLVAQSAIVASVPAIQYSRELLQPRDENRKTVIAPGKVGEWRLPCSLLLDLIPQEELAKIEAAGGDIDFV